MNDIYEVVSKKLIYEPDTGILRWRDKELKPAGSVVKGTGYLSISIGSTQYKAHRLAWLLYYGKWPDRYIDHINGDKLDNRITNLRDVSQNDNERNKPLQRNNKSGTPGVHWHKSRNSWQALIMVNGKHIYLGNFSELEKAVTARKEAEKKYGFHENHGRARKQQEPRHD